MAEDGLKNFFDQFLHDRLPDKTVTPADLLYQNNLKDIIQRTKMIINISMKFALSTITKVEKPFIDHNTDDTVDLCEEVHNMKLTSDVDNPLQVEQCQIKTQLTSQNIKQPDLKQITKSNSVSTTTTMQPSEDGDDTAKSLDVDDNTRNQSTRQNAKTTVSTQNLNSRDDYIKHVIIIPENAGKLYAHNSQFLGFEEKATDLIQIFANVYINIYTNMNLRMVTDNEKV